MAKRIVIAAGGWIRKPSLLKSIVTKEDFIIAADGGLVHLEEAGFHPNILIGDLDSLEEKERQKVGERGIRIPAHSKEKDDTDTELAIQHALSIDPEEILVVGGIGDRLDHTLSNVGLLLYGLKQRKNERSKNFPIVVLICNEILMIVGSDYGTKSLLFGLRDNML